MSNIAILPARLGSKRIKKKNIKIFYGKPMIQWTYEILKKSNIFSDIIVSTESDKIVRVCKNIGINTFIKRPAKLSDDNIGIKKVMKHAINQMEKKIKFENVCCIFPCSPFLKIKNLKKALKYIKNNKNCVVHPVSRFRCPPEKSLIMKKNNQLKVVNMRDMKKMTQDFASKYHDVGQFYFAHKSYWFKEKKKVKGIGIELQIWETVDIDNLEDWEFAKILFKFRKKNILKSKS